MLLVDADQAEPRHRREDRGAGADDDGCLAGDDPLALVAPLGVGQPGVQDGDAIAEAGLEAAERLRRQRDLGDEHDRAAARARAPPRRPGGRPLSCRSPSRPARSRWAPSPSSASTIRATARCCGSVSSLGLGFAGHALPRSSAARRAARGASARRARAPAPASSRSSRRPRARDRRAPAATRRARDSIGAVLTPAGASTPVSTTTPRAARAAEADRDDGALADARPAPRT